MATSVSLNGTNYDIPSVGDSFGTELSNYLIAISQVCLQKSGGSFTLTAEIDLGATYGLKTAYYKSQGSNVASAGVVRLANSENVSWRNNANSADLDLTVNTSDQLEFNGVALIGSSLGTAYQVLATNSGATAQEWTKLTNNHIDAVAAIAYSKLTLTGSVVNADINASAAIDATKIHDGSVSNTEFGYLNGVTSALQTQLDAKIDDFSSTTDNAIVRTNGTAGAAIQDTGITIDDSDNMTGVANLLVTGIIDRSTAAALSVGTANATTVNIGSTGVTTVIKGNLQVDGTTTTVNSTTMAVTDPNIVLNNGGNQAAADGTAGFTITMSDATDFSFLYDSSLASFAKLGQLGAESEIMTVGTAQTVTGQKTMTSPVLTTPQINDTSADHQYIIAVSELAADRNVTLPLLAADDEFVFKDHAVILGSKTLDAATIGGAANDGTDGYLAFKNQSADPSGVISANDIGLFAKSGKLYTIDENDVAVEVGSGAGGGIFNYVTNPSALSDASTGVTVANFTSVTRGTTESTFSDNYFILSTGTSASTCTVDWALDTLQEKHDNQLMRFSMRVYSPSTADTYKIGLHDGSAYVTGTELTLTNGANQKWDALFVLDRTATYTVRLERTSGTTDETLYIDDILVTPELTVTQSPITGWTSYTPTTQGFGTVSGVKMFYRRVGDCIEIAGGMTTGTVTASEAQVSLPDSLTIGDTDSGRHIRGRFVRNTASTNNLGTILITEGDTFVNFGKEDGGTSNPNDPANANVLFGNSQAFSFSTDPIPVAEWAGSVTTSANSRVQYYSNDGSNDVFSPNGSLVPNQAVGTAVSRTFTVGTRQPNEHPVLQIKTTNGEWVPAEQLYPRTYQGGIDYGVGLFYTSDTTMTVYFGDGGYRADNASYATNSSAAWSTLYSSGFRWRVVFSQNPLGIGAGLATDTQAGAVSSYKDSGAQDCPTLTWGGTAPTSLTGAKYRYVKIGNQVTLTVGIEYGSAGTGNTSVRFTLPSDIPAPAVVQLGNSSEYYSYSGSCTAGTSVSNSGTDGQTLFWNTGSATDLYMVFASTNAAAVRAVITYITDE